MAEQFNPNPTARRARGQDTRELAQILLAERGGGNPKDYSLDGENQTAVTDAMRLQQLAKAANKWAIMQCNGIERKDAKTGRTVASWTDADDARKERAQHAIATEAKAIAARYNIEKVSVGGDPRGFVLHLYLKSERYNSWGGKESGWGIG